MLDDLERKFVWPRLENDFEVMQDNQMMCYNGYFYSIEFRGQDILGHIIINKYEMKEKAKHKLFRKDEIKSIQTKTKLIWNLDTSRGTNKKSYIVKDGKPAIDYLVADNYRSAIRAQGFMNKVDLSPELLDKIFKPIDEKMMMLYKQAFGSHSYLQQKNDVHDGDAR